MAVYSHVGHGVGTDRPKPVRATMSSDIEPYFHWSKTAGAVCTARLPTVGVTVTTSLVYESSQIAHSERGTARLVCNAILCRWFVGRRLTEDDRLHEPCRLPTSTWHLSLAGFSWRSRTARRSASRLTCCKQRWALGVITWDGRLNRHHIRWSACLGDEKKYRSRSEFGIRFEKEMPLFLEMPEFL